MPHSERCTVSLGSALGLFAVHVLTFLPETLNPASCFQSIIVSPPTFTHSEWPALPLAVFLGLAAAHGGLTEITGRYSYIGNPCTTDPCLPGMAHAILANDNYYYLTVNGHFLSDNRPWEDYAPEVGDLITVAGHSQEKRDVFGKPFYTIEVESLKPAKRESARSEE